MSSGLYMCQIGFNTEYIIFKSFYSDLMEFEEHCSALGIQVIPILEVAPLVQFEDIDELYDMFQDFLSCFHDSQYVYCLCVFGWSIFNRSKCSSEIQQTFACVSWIVYFALLYLKNKF